MSAKQRGFTLVELLVTLVISSALVAVLGQILLQSRQTYKSQETLSHMMEDGRYILEVLTKETRRIGFLRNRFAIPVLGSAVGSAATVFIADNNLLGSGIDLPAGAFIGGDYDPNGFSGTYDVNKLVFRYQLNDAIELSAASTNYSPCTRDIGLDAGEDPTRDIHAISIYLYIALDNTSATPTPTLYCEAKREIIDPIAGTPTLIKQSARKPLLSNMERLLILYGVDTDADTAANVYLRADGVQNGGNWRNIVSIRLYLVLSSGERNIAQGNPTYLIDGQSIIPDAPADRRLYRVFSTTITSRNF